MSKLIDKKIKNTLLLTALGASLALTGCGKKEENKVKVTPTTEVTTETIIENTTETQVEEKQTINYEAVATESYNQYKDFYNQYYTDMNEEEIKQNITNMAKVLNDDLTTMTQDELIDSLSLINQILLSDSLYQSIDNRNNNISLDFTPAYAPTLVPFVANEDVKSDLTKYEQLRDQIQISAINGSITESDKQALLNAVVEMETDYTLNQGNMNSDIQSEGASLVQNTWKKKLILLTVFTTNQTMIETEDYTIKLSCTDEERDKIAVYENLDRNGQEIPDSLKIEVAQIKMSLPETKYDEGICAAQNLMFEKVNKNVIPVSSNDKKQKLESYKMVLEMLKAYNDEDVKQNKLYI